MRIEKEKSQLLLIDVQEKLFPHMENQEILRKKVITLLEGMKALAIPIMAARQYPKGLGDTIEELGVYFSHYYDKMAFSCCGSAELLAEFDKTGRKNIIITGIEAHVCVLQTVIDLKSLGFTPIVVVDAISSRDRRDYEIALKRMEYEGAILATVESILFELCHSAGTEDFKKISRLVK
ncbi:hydrolase [Pelosinus sp. sgz500959]|uniref:hydrolase n=1 Tax=Pelosinus sp. sgz500959 TaxID=3242472 RepID=UPI00366B5DC4